MTTSTLDTILSRSAVARDFAHHVSSGTRVPCAVVLASDGYGKTTLAGAVADLLKEANVPMAFVSADLTVDIDLSQGDVQAVVVDVAEQASPELLDQLRAVAQNPVADWSILLFTRSVSSSAAMSALCAVADRTSTLEELPVLSTDELEQLVPAAASLSSGDLIELTGAIPSIADRLCHGWNESSWPQDVMSIELPSRFVRHVEMTLPLLSEDELDDLATQSLATTYAPDTEAPAVSGVRAAGLACADGRIPRAVALAVDALLTPDQRRQALIRSALPLIGTDPRKAAEMFDASGSPELAAVARAAAGDFAAATALVHDLPRVRGAAAAAAHIAGAESRWNDAADLARQATPHPYWTDIEASSARAIYDVLAMRDAPSNSDESFSSRAASALHAALAASTRDDLAEVTDQLRALARQASNQPPMLDVAVSGTEIAAIAALTISNFDLAAGLLEAAPESAQRSSLNAALASWIGVRTGCHEITTDHDSPTVAAQTLRLAAELIDARRSSDATSTAEAAAAIAGLVAQMSVDLLSFDALCEVHVGAHRADARGPARDIRAGLERFVDRSGDTPALNVRQRWSDVEAAVAGGDPAALSAAADALLSISDVDHLSPALAAAARQWPTVLAGAIDPDALRSTLDELEIAGYVWEAATLAGNAAVRTDDVTLAKELLARGREFRAAAPEKKLTSPAGLSEREIEIGLLVLKGHSYKEIGAECFISPKTVEHHVAHIRQKLTAVGVPRAEFRAKLQADLQPDG